MAVPKLVSVDQPGASPLPISARLRSQLVYFMADATAAGVPPLGENEYWFTREEVAKWLDEGVFYLVSPLDTANMTEVELTEEQEAMLTWLDRNQVRHVRVVE
ncbi:MAG TPA: hypothetical protein VHS97_25205 [Isosphaeraceae bacterium]|jgi:acetyl-CoA carboxylase carboxyltransferase component|nr:hypothetical protein [Isosphaeraceae bacterium]